MPQDISINHRQNLWNEPAQEIPIEIELVVFNIDEISLGLSISKVDRVITVNSTDRDLSYLEGVQQRDLHQQLLGTSCEDPAAWIVVKGLDGAYYLPVDTLPTLICVTLDLIRMLPSDFRTNNPLGIASHVAMIAAEVGELIVFILDN